VVGRLVNSPLLTGINRVSLRGAEVGDIRCGLCVVGVIDDAMVLD
jgi:hypothetical protein